jgi:putative heme-binding domain-containing protein
MTTASFHRTLMGTPHAGTFTAASGVHVHRGDALPAGHGESIFVCESAQNLVQRQVRSPLGVTFTSRPARSGREFLASRDNWFRPVFAANGPDGALYIVDMYRHTIDHPQYVPEDSRALLNFEAGKDRGRIYRIVAEQWTRDRTPIDLGRMSAARLSQLLEHANAWWRETAQRLLVERRDRRVASHLRTVAAGSGRDVARIHALWTLDGLGALEVADIIAALADRDASVRENAVRLAETRLGSSAGLLSHVLRLAEDPDDRVRLRVALALGETADPRAMTALAALARRDGAQSWMRAAILSSVRERSDDFLRAFVASPSSNAVRAAMMQDLGQLFGAGQTPERCLDLIVQIAEPGTVADWQPAALAGIARGLSARGLDRAGRTALMAILASDSPEARQARPRVDMVIRRSSELALDEQAPQDLRLAAVALLGQTDVSSAAGTLQRLLAPNRPSEIQVAAVHALSRLPGSAGPESLVQPDRWLAFTPELREAVLSALLTDDRLTDVLLDAVAAKSIPPASLGSSRRTRLMNHPSDAIRQRAGALFAAVESGDRMKIYEQLRETVLTRTGDATSGGRIFSTMCGSCHTFDGAGGRLGPDLSGIRNQPADAILLHVLVPEYEITPGYQTYLVETRDRRRLSGRLESETPGSVTIRDGSGQSHAILRSELVSMSASPASLMPNELERTMSAQDLADVISYLKSVRAPAATDR